MSITVVTVYAKMFDQAAIPCFLFCIVAASVVGLLSLKLVLDWIGPPEKSSHSGISKRWSKLNRAWRTLRVSRGRQIVWSFGSLVIAYIGFKRGSIPGKIDLGLVSLLVGAAVIIVTPSMIDLLMLFFFWIFGQ